MHATRVFPAVVALLLISSSSAFNENIYESLCQHSFSKGHVQDLKNTPHIVYAKVQITNTTENLRHRALQNGLAYVSAYLIARFVNDLETLRNQYIEHVGNVPYNPSLINLPVAHLCRKTVDLLTIELGKFNDDVMCHAASIFLVDAFPAPDTKSRRFKGCFEYRVHVPYEKYSNLLIPALELAQSAYTNQICQDVISEKYKRRPATQQQILDALPQYVHIESAMMRSKYAITSPTDEGHFNKSHMKDVEKHLKSIDTQISAFSASLKVSIPTFYSSRSGSTQESVKAFWKQCMGDEKPLRDAVRGLEEYIQLRHAGLLRQISDDPNLDISKVEEVFPIVLKKFNDDFAQIGSSLRRQPKSAEAIHQRWLMASKEPKDNYVRYLIGHLRVYARSYFYDGIINQLPPEISKDSCIGLSSCNIRRLGIRKHVQELIILFDILSERTLAEIRNGLKKNQLSASECHAKLERLHKYDIQIRDQIRKRMLSASTPLMYVFDSDDPPSDAREAFKKYSDIGINSLDIEHRGATLPMLVFRIEKWSDMETKLKEYRDTLAKIPGNNNSEIVMGNYSFFLGKLMQPIQYMAGNSLVFDLNNKRDQSYEQFLADIVRRNEDAVKAVLECSYLNGLAQRSIIEETIHNLVPAFKTAKHALRLEGTVNKSMVQDSVKDTALMSVVSNCVYLPPEMSEIEFKFTPDDNYAERKLVTDLFGGVLRSEYKLAFKSHVYSTSNACQDAFLAGNKMPEHQRDSLQSMVKKTVKNFMQEFDEDEEQNATRFHFGSSSYREYIDSWAIRLFQRMRKIAISFKPKVLADDLIWNLHLHETWAIESTGVNAHTELLSSTLEPFYNRLYGLLHHTLHQARVSTRPEETATAYIGKRLQATQIFVRNVFADIENFWSYFRKYNIPKSQMTVVQIKVKLDISKNYRLSDLIKHINYAMKIIFDYLTPDVFETYIKDVQRIAGAGKHCDSVPVAAQFVAPPVFVTRPYDTWQNIFIAYADLANKQRERNDKMTKALCDRPSSPILSPLSSPMRLLSPARSDISFPADSETEKERKKKPKKTVAFTGMVYIRKHRHSVLPGVKTVLKKPDDEESLMNSPSPIVSKAKLDSAPNQPFDFLLSKKFPQTTACKGSFFTVTIYDNKWEIPCELKSTSEYDAWIMRKINMLNVNMQNHAENAIKQAEGCL